MEGHADRLEPLKTAISNVVAEADATVDGHLILILGLAALVALIFVVPVRRGSEWGAWSRIWACGTICGLFAVILFALR